MDELKAGHEGSRPYRAVIRRGKQIVWRADHTHQNRDFGNWHDCSARGCAVEVLTHLTNPEFTKTMASYTAWRTGEERAHSQWAQEQAAMIRTKLEAA